MILDLNLNNVEWATLFWYVVILTIALCFDHRGVVGIMKIFFNSRPLIILLALLILWCIFEILVLIYFNIELKSQVKNISVWFFTVALVLPYTLVVKRNDQNVKVMPGKVIWDNFKFSAFLEILFTTYTLSLIAQIFYTGIIILFSILAAFSFKKEQQSVKSFFQIVLLVLTIPYVFYVVFQFWKDPNQFFQTSTLIDYLIPILLSSLYIPFAWGVATWISFDDVLSKTYRRIEDKSVRNYARRRTFFDLILYPEVSIRWKHEVKRTLIISKEDVDKSLERALAAYEIEKLPPQVSLSEGWSPYLAQKFMTNEGFETGFYDKYQDDVWNSFSNYIGLSDGILNNKANYFIEGNAHVAKSLNLKMSIYELNCKEVAMSRFADMCRLLFQQALNMNITNDLETKLSQLKNFKITLDGKEISLDVDLYNVTVPLIQISFRISA